jgi:DnaJ-class molecular chaperone
VAQKDYYKILGVSPKAPPDEIKKAYRAAIRQWHPDRNPENQTEAARKTAEYNEAWENLGDPARRKAYDQTRGGGAGPAKRPGAASGAARPKAPGARARPSNFAGGPLQDILQNMQRGSQANARAETAARKTTASSARTGEYELVLTPAEAQNGGIKVLDINGTAVKIAIPPGQTDGKTLPLILRVRVGG